MVGLVLFSHAGLSDAFMDVLKMVAGEQEHVASVGVSAGEKADDVKSRLDEAIRATDAGCGVIVVTDLFGGSPANLALARLVPGKVEIVSGLNLAMLLKAIDLRMRKLEDPIVMARAMVREGQENISLASDILAKRSGGDGKSSRAAGGAG
ncbi:MAG: hypothetical protein JXR96_12095 [Deltaproteobacteria bacterium]|nr:hypothetical protein [Deltaproteobacteria bacterium]